MFRRIFGENKENEENAVPEGTPAVPKDSLGLHILYEPEDGDVTVDIVAVHGLGGGSHSTWTHKNGTNWLSDLLPSSLSKARIMAFGYDAGMITKARTERSFTFAEGLLVELRDVRSGKARLRPLFFLAHSLGGIVVKKALIIASGRRTRYGDIFESTRHLMFFGTPHQGTTSTAGFLRRLGAALSADASVLRELELWSPQVLETNSAFLTEIAPMFTITTYWEREKISGVQVVDEGSARLNQTHEDVIGLDADHRSMCKFIDARDNKFLKVSRRLLFEVGSLEDPTSVGIKDPRVKDLLKNTQFATYLQSLSQSRFRLEFDQWISREYDDSLALELRVWINPPSFDDGDFLKHYGKLSRHSRESAQWIFHHDAFRSWQARESPLLWVAGRPGCGKSVLAANAVQHFRSLSSMPGISGTHATSFIAYAFSDKQDEGKKSSVALLRIILWQMLTSNQLLTSQKVEILSDCRSTSPRHSTVEAKSASDGFDYVSSLFQKYIAMFSQITIVFDGIDECQDPEILVKMLTNLMVQRNEGFSVFISSQKIMKIAQYLDYCTLRIDMEEDKVRELTNKDIQNYIDSEFSKSNNPLIKNQRKIVVDLVSTKANGMFLWAAIAVPEIQAKAALQHDTMDQFLEAVQELPENMEATFLYLLDRILQPELSSGARTNQRLQAVLLRILQWAFHANRPLSIDEMQTAITIVDPSETSANPTMHHNVSGLLDIDGLLTMCYPLLYVSTRVVHIMHSAFTAFVLPTDNSPPSGEIKSKLGDVSFQSLFAARCLVYLSQPQFKDFVKCSSNENIFQESPFLEYAVSNWVPHTLKDPELNPSLRRQITDFLATRQAICWLELWHKPTIDSLKNLQSQLFRHQGYVTNPQWVRKLLDCSAEERLDVAPDSPRTRVVLVQLGDLSRFHGLTEDAERIFIQLYNREKRCLTPNDPSLRDTMNHLAMVYSDARKLSQAKQLYQELLSILKSLPGEHAEEINSVSGNLASLYCRTGQYEEAEKTYSKILDESLVKFGTQHPTVWFAYSNLGCVCLAQARFASAKEYSLKAVELHTEFQGKGSLGALLAMNNLASAESALGDHERAAELSQHVWTMRRSLLGDTHPDTIVSGNNYASNLSELDRFDDATAILEELLKHQRKLRGDFHPSTLTLISNLAYTLANQSRHSESLQWVKMSLANRTVALGETHPDTLLSMSNLAQSYESDYDLIKAEQLMVKSFKLYSETLGPGHNSTLTVRGTLVTLCSLQNRYALAEHLAARNVALSKVNCTEVHPNYLLRQRLLAGVWCGVGRFEEAEHLLKKILRVCSQEAITDSAVVFGTKLELSITYRQLGMYAKAEESALEVFEHFKPGGGGDKGSKVWIREAQTQLALALQKLGNIEDALEMAQQVADRERKRFGVGSKALFRSQCVLASIHLDAGHAEMAEELIIPVVETWSTLLGRDHSLTGMALSVLARSRQKQMRYEEAEPLHIQAMVARQAALGPRHPLTLEMKHNYAMLLFEIGDIAEAERLLCETLEERKTVLRGGHPDLNRSIEDLTEVRKSGTSKGLSFTRVEARSIPPDETEQHLLQTLTEACTVLGPRDPDTLLIKRDVALFYRSSGRVMEAKKLLEKSLAEHIDVQSACHVDTLSTLVELLDVSGDHTQLKQEQFDLCLINSIRNKNVNLLQRLLECGADPSKREPETNLSSLCFAVHRDEAAMVECLLKFGVEVDVLGHDGSTALHKASAQGLTRIVKLLIDFGANPNILDGKNGRSPLYLACFHDRLDVVKVLLEGRADPNLAEDVPPLNVSAGYNRSGIAECLLEHKANMESLSSVGWTPLLHAIFCGHLSMVEMLIKRGANMDFKTKNGGGGPLHWACVNFWKGMVTLLITKGCDPNECTFPSGTRPLHIAVELGNVEIVEELLLGGASLDLCAETESALTPLATAARFGQVNVLTRILREDKQTPNLQVGRLKLSPLHLAASFGHVETLEKLIEAGADLNPVTTGNATPLIEAVRDSRLSVVEKLTAAGADANVRSPGVTALALALGRKDLKIIEALVKYPQTDLNAPIFDTVKPILLAIYILPKPIVELMLAKGASPSTSSPYSQITALHLAVLLKEYEILNMILASGVDQSIQDAYGRTAIDWVDLDDTSFPMLDPDYRTSRSHQLARTKITIVDLTRFIRHALRKGRRKLHASVRDRLEVIAFGLLLSGAMDDAIIALEQGFAWTTTSEGPVIQHSLTCDGCREPEDIIGPIHVCKTCGATIFCEKCYQGHVSGELRRALCQHDATDFFQVPRDSWYSFEASGIVHVDPLSGVGENLDDWLARLEDMYDDVERLPSPADVEVT